MCAKWRDARRGNAALLPGPPYVARPRYVSGCDGLTERGASATLEALSLGASDYATKPDNVTSPAEARENIPAELIPKIKSLCRAGGGRRAANDPTEQHAWENCKAESPAP